MKESSPWKILKALRLSNSPVKGKRKPEVTNDLEPNNNNQS